MKRLIILVVILFCSLSLLKAQEFRAGVLSGVLATQVDGDYMSGYYKAGFIGGLFVYRDVFGAARIQGELVFATKGSRCAPKNPNPDFLQVSTSSIDLSLMYIYKVSESLNFRIGLTPSALLSAKEVRPTGVIQDPDNSPDFRRFGILGLAGVTYNLNKRFSITWSYNYSLLSIRSGNSEIYDLGFHEKNAQYHNYMSFVLGYTF
jgi:hypothetical protein